MLHGKAEAGLDGSKWEVEPFGDLDMGPSLEEGQPDDEELLVGQPSDRGLNMLPPLRGIEDAVRAFHFLRLNQLVDVGLLFGPAFATVAIDPRVASDRKYPG